MSVGFIQVIVLLTTLGGFGVSSNSKAPSGTEVMKYAPANADAMIHVDLQALVPGNYKLLQGLPNHKLVSQHAEARKGIEQMIREVEFARGMVKNRTGVDLVQDVHSLTAWAKFPSAGMPHLLVVVRGSFTDALLEAAAQMGGARSEIDGTKAVQSPDGAIMLAVRQSEVILGSTDWVKARMSKSWKAPRVAGGSPSAKVRKMLDKKPFYLAASNPSKQAVRRMMSELPRDNVAADIVSGHKFGALALSSKGVTWTIDAHSKEGYERALMASEGMLDVFRASHIGTRGMGRVLMSALRSYRGKSKEIDMVLKHENELLDVMTKLTGDGKFRSNVKKNARGLSFTVTATGKKLSDVLPLMGVMPMIGAAAFLARGADDVAMSKPRHAHKTTAKPEAAAPERARGDVGASADAAATTSAAAGLNVRSIYRAVKQARGM